MKPTCPHPEDPDEEFVVLRRLNWLERLLAFHKSTTCRRCRIRNVACKVVEVHDESRYGPRVTKGEEILLCECCKSWSFTGNVRLRPFDHVEFR